MEIELIRDLAIALGLGLLVGLQRQWSHSKIAGIRTFPLITMLGALCGLVGREAGAAWIIGAGLIAGKEGPFVHGGGLVGGGLSAFGSHSLGFKTRKPSYFRDDANKRDFVAIGTATGVAVAFGAPIGGMLFTVEEGRRGVIVTLLAVLELVREMLIELVQAKPLGPIHVRAQTS